MWLKISENRLCSNCDIPIEHWVLYGQSGRTVGEASFCPICYPDVRGPICYVKKKSLAGQTERSFGPGATRFLRRGGRTRWAPAGDLRAC